MTKEQRSRAKTANFGIIYGISTYGLSQRIGMSRSDSKALIEEYFNNYPGVREYINRMIASAKEKGYVETIYGRRRFLPDINSRNSVVRGYNERNAINAPLQGSAADIIKLAMINVYKRLKTDGLKSRMVLQVHDELVLDVIDNEKNMMGILAFKRACRRRGNVSQFPDSLKHSLLLGSVNIAVRIKHIADNRLADTGFKCDILACDSSSRHIVPAGLSYFFLNRTNSFIGSPVS